MAIKLVRADDSVWINTGDGNITSVVRLDMAHTQVNFVSGTHVRVEEAHQKLVDRLSGRLSWGAGR